MVCVATEPTLRRGDVWLVDFGTDPQDPEQAFQRPAVVVSHDRLHHPNLQMVIVVPGTSTMRGTPVHVRVEPGDTGLTTTTEFQIEQVRAISTKRLVRRLGRLDTVSRHTIDEILRNVLDL